jgi:tryptophanyl-tRNA synthetase
MVTDPARYRRTDPGDPDKCPVWDLHRFFNDDAEERAELDRGCRTAGIGCIDCKKKLYAHMLHVLEPVQARRRHYEARRDDLVDIVRAGADRARRIARSTMEEIYRGIGMFR